MHLPCYLAPSSRVRLLVIAMIIFLHASRSIAEPHSSVCVHFVIALMFSTQCALRLPLFLVPPPIPIIIHFFQTGFSSHSMTEIWQYVVASVLMLLAGM